MHTIKMFIATFAIGLIAVAAPAHAADIAIPWGDWLAAALVYFREIIVAAIVGLIGLALRGLPTQIRDILLAARVEQLLTRAVDYGVATVSGAAKGKTMTVPVANQVIAEAMAYALGHAPSLAGRLGETLKPKIVARLSSMLPAEADAQTLNVDAAP